MTDYSLISEPSLPISIYGVLFFFFFLSINCCFHRMVLSNPALLAHAWSPERRVALVPCLIYRWFNSIKAFFKFLLCVALFFVLCGESYRHTGLASLKLMGLLYISKILSKHFHLLFLFGRGICGLRKFILSADTLIFGTPPSRLTGSGLLFLPRLPHRLSREPPYQASWPSARRQPLWYPSLSPHLLPSGLSPSPSWKLFSSHGPASGDVTGETHSHADKCHCDRGCPSLSAQVLLAVF